MNKKVLVSISGLQTEIGDDEAVEVISPGEYHERDGRHYILYEEMHEEGETPFGNLLIGLYTTNISVVEEKEEMIATIDYSLDINYDYVSDCNIKIKVSNRNQ